MDNLNITTLDELRSVSGGEVVKLTGFTSDKSFYARLKRPSLLQLAAAGVIPNSLLGVAEMLFSGLKETSGLNIKETAELLLIIAGAALQEPSHKELLDNGIQLTDMQLIEIFNYTQTGVKALESFREYEQGDEGDSCC